MSALGSCSALFFAALLVHVRIRGEVGATRSMIYMEYFYFVMYAAIMAVTLNAYLFPLKKMHKLLDENDNRMPKLIYWPLLSGSLFLITAVVFY